MKTEPTRRKVLYLAAWNAASVHEGIVAFAHEAGWILDNSLCYTGEMPSGVQPDGVICRHARRDDIIALTRSLGVPTVAFEHDDRLPVPRVYFDEDAIGAIAARHLIERGFRELCFLHLGLNIQQRPRMDGFRREAETAGCRFTEVRPAERPATWHAPPGKDWDWLENALAALDKPIGMMVTNDQIARPSIDALVHMGFSIPTQIAVVSAENDAMICDTAAVPISSVEANVRQMGYEAARRLNRLMDGESVGGDTLRIRPSRVQVRASSDVRAIPNEQVAQALHYIWTHYAEPIRVQDVAGSVPVTRRHLQTLFQQQVGRTMREELARVRAARACFLLKFSTLRVSEIAERCGFSSALHLHRTLQSVVGMGPKDFRNEGSMPELGVAPASVESEG